MTAHKQNGQQKGKAVNINYQPTKMYRLDPTKIKTIEDVVRVLDLMGLSFPETYTHFKEIKPYLKTTVEFQPGK